MGRRGYPLVAALLAVTVACAGSRGDALGLIRISEAMPELRGPTLDGGTIEPSDYRGKVLLVNVWATWCGPCRREQPFLQRAWEAFQDRGVVFIGINYRDDPAAARIWVEDEFRVTYPSVVDEAGAWADDFGFSGLPTTYFVDRGGTMRYRILGEAKEESVVRVLEELLAEGS